MAEVSPIPRPRTVVNFKEGRATPTVRTPTMPAVVIGICKDLVELTDDNGNATTDAQASLPAYKLISVGSGLSFLGSETLKLRVDNGAEQTITFTLAGTYNAQQVANTINNGLIGGVAVVEGTNVVLRSNSIGANSKLEILSTGTANLILFATANGSIHYGAARYNNYDVTFREDHLPDPNDLEDQREVLEGTVRAYVLRGGVLTELLDDSGVVTAALRRRDGGLYSPNAEYAHLMKALNDGDGDNFTPRLYARGNDASIVEQTVGTSKYKIWALSDQVGHVNIGDYHGIAGDGINVIITTAAPNPAGRSIVEAPAGTVTIDVEPAATINDVVTYVNSDVGNTWLYMGLTGGLGTDTIVALGSTPTAGGVDPANMLESASKAAVRGGIPFATYNTQLLGKSFKLRLDGGRIREMVFQSASYATSVLLKAEMDAALDLPSDVISFEAITEEMIISPSTSPDSGFYGQDSVVHLVEGGGIDVIFGTSYVNQKYRGIPGTVAFGDDLYLAGNRAGKVIGFANWTVGNLTFNNVVLIIDSEVDITATFVNWYVLGKNLTGNDGNNRPKPNFSWTNGDGLMKHDSMVGVDGVPVPDPNYLIYLPHEALRLDLTTNFGTRAQLVTLDQPTDVPVLLGKVDLDNPLALACDLAMSEAPEQRLFALGIDEISETEPWGTKDAWQRALEALEAHRIHAMGCLTDSETVIHLIEEHVQANSEPIAGRPRMAFVSLPSATENTPALLGTGSGDATVLGDTITLDAGEIYVHDLLTDLVVNPAAITVDEGIYITISGIDGKFNILSYNQAANAVTVRYNGWAIGDNDEAFYENARWSGALAAATISLFHRGTPFLTLYDEALTNSLRSEELANEAVYNVFNDGVGAILNGQEVLLDPVYACAVTAAMVAEAEYNAPFSNARYSSITRVVGTQDKYSSSHLDLIAGGGNWILFQEFDDGPVSCRRQLSTYSSSNLSPTLTQMEANMVRLKHFMTFFFSDLVRAYLGSTLVTDEFLDHLRMVLEGGRQYIVEKKRYVRNLTWESVEEDSTSPDTVRARGNATLPAPFNEMIFDIVL